MKIFRVKYSVCKERNTGVTFMAHAATALIGLACLLVSGCQQGPKSGSTDSIDAFMASLSDQAVERAKSGYGVKLDYSADSVKEVEKILAMKYDMTHSYPVTEEQISDAAHIWGAYIGEVIKRQHPAHWERDSSVGGKGALPIVFNDTGEQSFPCAWVYHRLKNGEEDDVWVKFRFVTQPGGLKQHSPEKKKPAPPTQNKSTP
jgi:hypothetical protein